MRLQSLLRGAHSFLAPQAALAGLTPAQAHAAPSRSPHSVAEIVAHMAFWQDWFLDRCDGRQVPAPARAAFGWPSVATGSWSAVHERFEQGFTRALRLADDEERTSQPIAPPLEFDFLKGYTTGDALAHLALHNAHHLGQIVVLRQQAGAWPPPAGSWTW